MSLEESWATCIYIYTHTHRVGVCIYKYEYVCTYLYIRILNTYIFTCTYEYLYVLCVYTYICVCTCVCTCVCDNYTFNTYQGNYCGLLLSYIWEVTPLIPLSWYVLSWCSKFMAHQKSSSLFTQSKLRIISVTAWQLARNHSETLRISVSSESKL